MCSYEIKIILKIIKTTVGGIVDRKTIWTGVGGTIKTMYCRDQG